MRQVMIRLVSLQTLHSAMQQTESTVSTPIVSMFQWWALHVSTGYRYTSLAPAGSENAARRLKYIASLVCIVCQLSYPSPGCPGSNGGISHLLQTLWRIYMHTSHLRPVGTTYCHLLSQAVSISCHTMMV
jgi:hypothetical protein